MKSMRQRKTSAHHIKVIPNSIDRWRGRNWNQIKELEGRAGDGVRIIKYIDRIIKVHDRELVEKRMNPKRLHNQAFEIENLLSEATDEILMAEGKIPRDIPVGANYGELWNEYYLNALRHYWPKLSSELKKEILKQIKHE